MKDAEMNPFQSLRQAAEQGDPTSQYNLGVMYNVGGGVAQNTEEAKNGSTWRRRRHS